MMAVVNRPAVQLQLALSAAAIISVLTASIGGSVGSIAVPVACAAALCWVVRALLSHRISQGVDLLFLCAMLIGSAITAVPTHAAAVEPMVGSLIIVAGDALRPRWMLWAWVAVGVLAAGIGFVADPLTGPAVAVGIVLVLSIVAVASRRAGRREDLHRFRALERQYAVELERARIAAERIITPERLRERFPALSAREADVLSLIAHGESNDEVAAELFVSVSTVKSHVNAVFAKLPARDRAQAIALVLGTARTHR